MFVHSRLAPTLARLGIGESVKMYDSGDGNPLVEVRFPAEATPEVTSAVCRLAGHSTRDRS